MVLNLRDDGWCVVRRRDLLLERSSQKSRIRSDRDVRMLGTLESNPNVTGRSILLYRRSRHPSAIPPTTCTGYRLVRYPEMTIELCLRA